eukprot:scaffold110376_cov63-Phaeocystis_antarctica.AAC.1
MSRHAKPQHLHGLAELLLAHPAVAVVVPVAEEVDDAHGIGCENIAQLLLHVAIGVDLHGRGKRRTLLIVSEALLTLATGRDRAQLVVAERPARLGARAW